MMSSWEDSLLKPSIIYESGFYDAEHDGTRSFRWAQQQSEITIKSRGRCLDHGEQIVLNLLLGVPDELTLEVIVSNGQRETLALLEGWRVYSINLVNWNSEMNLRLKSKKFFLDGARSLGFMFGSVFFTSKAKNVRFYTELKRDQSVSISLSNKPFLSAYYYLWYFTPDGARSSKPFSGKWSEGYARALLEPPQYPTLGEYVMNDPEVIETHIDWAADHGIDCFICNWEGMEGHRKFLSENLVHILQGADGDGSYSLGKIPYSKVDSTGNRWDAVSQKWDRNGYKIRNLTRMKFSALIESRLILADWPPKADGEQCVRAFVNALVYMAENYFCSPQWLRINGKPVVYIYEVYSWRGDSDAFVFFRNSVDEAIKAIADPLTGNYFEGVYIVADVVYPYEQDMDRLRVFDAVTGYQPYPPVNTDRAKTKDADWNYFGAELFRSPAFESYHKKFFDWCKSNGVDFIPTVIPKYNDRGVRGAIDNYAYPPGATPPYQDVNEIRDVRLFKENIVSQMRWLDRKTNMMNVNSWNEWFEDTSIEPVGFIPAMDLPDYYGQGDNIGSSTTNGRDRRVPEKVVIYGHDGNKWIETPESIKESGIDVTQGYAWVCYGFDYLFGLKDLFGLEYSNVNSGKREVS